MIRAKLSLSVVSALLLIVPLGSRAQDVDAGRIEYMANCAQCHGTGGDGDGVIARYLTVPPTDLTGLSAAADGFFPFEMVYGSISSGKRSAAHGTREMPAWGDRYAVEAMQYYGLPYSPDERDAYIHGQILSLISYLESIQK